MKLDFPRIWLNVSPCSHLRNVSITFYCYTDMKHFDRCTNGIIRVVRVTELTSIFQPIRNVHTIKIKLL